MTKRITSFTHHVTGEGNRISLTFSELDTNGLVTNTNQRMSFVVVDDNILNAINTINDFYLEKLEEQ
ncbi:MAG: hypothetical protein LBV67_06735 [Streptococcaceae bacterium]|jgi:hypothetical protein|nr:hypothetical protein [Streptococcaceae bacterium]